MGTIIIQRYTPITVTQTAPFQTINLTIDLVVSMELIKQVAIAVNMDRKKCRLSPGIYHINILRNPNEVDVYWGRSAKPK